MWMTENDSCKHEWPPFLLFYDSLNIFIVLILTQNMLTRDKTLTAILKRSRLGTV